jgi:hypothetical protein
MRKSSQKEAAIVACSRVTEKETKKRGIQQTECKERYMVVLLQCKQQYETTDRCKKGIF